MYTLMDFFRETISRPLEGALKFLHTLQIDKGLLHTPEGGRGRENLKFTLKFSVLESITSGIVEVFSLNFFMRPAITARAISSSWNWFCTRTCGAGRPHVWLCHARLVLVLVLVLVFVLVFVFVLVLVLVLVVQQAATYSIAAVAGNWTILVTINNIIAPKFLFVTFFQAIKPTV